MGRNTSKIKLRINARESIGRVVLALQWLFLLFGVMKKIPAFSSGDFWTAVVYFTDFPKRWMISAAGLAAIADSFSVAGALFVWIVNLAPERCCAVPMPVLYKWAYPHFKKIFFLTMGLLFLCIYEGEASSVCANPTAGTCFFTGGFIGSLYILDMCWTFVFSGAKLNMISHSYIIERIHDIQESRFSADLLRKHLLEDCYNCLENRYFDNLETILNESLVNGYEEIPSVFDDTSSKTEIEQFETVEKQIAFLQMQLTAWGTILSGRPPAECVRLLGLDLDRLRLELAGEPFPPFRLVKRKENTSAEKPKYDNISVRAHRAVWFFMIIQTAWENSDVIFSQIYTEAVRELNKSGCSLKAVNDMFHQLLLIAHLYFAIDRAVRGREEAFDVKWYVLLSSMRSQLSTSFELTEDRFERLLTLSAQMYAANNYWSLQYYLSKLVTIQELGCSVRSDLERGTISLMLRFNRTVRTDPAVQQ